MKRVGFSLSFGVWICVFLAVAQTPKTGQWEPFEISMSGGSELANAYVDGLPDSGKPFVIVTFTGTSGDAKGLSYTVPGFWDGGKTWRARFAAPAAGQWSYSASSTDPVLRGVKGSFQCAAWSNHEKGANPVRHGFVRVAKNGPRAGRYFEYADGTPFLWIGDTWWPWLKRGIPFTRAKQVIDDRSTRGFTIGQVVFGANNATRLAGRDFATPDLDAIHDAERFIAYANSQGICAYRKSYLGQRGPPHTCCKSDVRAIFSGNNREARELHATNCEQRYLVVSGSENWNTCPRVGIAGEDFYIQAARRS